MTLTQVWNFFSAVFRFLGGSARQTEKVCIVQWYEKPVTRALLKKCFGKDARIFGWGCYRVTTPNGGLVWIGPVRWKLVKGGEDVYQALVLLGAECWGSMKVKGSREHVLGLIGHGEACGINVQPDLSDRRATFARWCVALLVFCISATLVPDSGGSGTGVGRVNWALWIPFALPLVVFGVMKRRARREEQRKLERNNLWQGAGLRRR
jgi:hypothetical protein